MGEFLFEGEESAQASWQADGRPVSARDDLFAQRLADARAFGLAGNGLAKTHPDLSAKGGLWIWQRAAGWAAVIAFVFLLLVRTEATFVVSMLALSVVFGFLILMRLGASLLAMLSRGGAAPARIPDSQLWTLTILVPLLREGAGVVRALIEAITRLDYPPDKLDVKLLIEADDEETLAAVQAVRLPPWFEIVPVPPGEPRTKPKALNYGLATARGRIVAVFDAEDRPAPDQPRAAMTAFLNGGRKLAVVQAPLLIHNGADGWLAGQFEVEYAIHFRVWLPFLAWLKLPLALGGTSNYFRHDLLKAAGGWDPWNVTEDADIGLRLARLGGGAQMISPPTMEEAPAQMLPWLRQRTRWMKGHLQTWFVLMRRPFRVARELGLFRFLATQLTLGGSLLASMAHAPLLAMVFVSTFVLGNIEPWQAILFGVGYASVVTAAIAARARHAKLWTLITLPVYWPLQSVAMLWALIEVKHRPHVWAKTPHGLANEPSAAPAEPLPASETKTGSDNVVQLDFGF